MSQFQPSEVLKALGYTSQYAYIARMWANRELYGIIGVLMEADRSTITSI